MLRKPLFRNRLLARALLYTGGVLAVVGVVVLANWLREPIAHWSWNRSVEEWLSHEEVELLQEYLRIDTSYPDGNEIPAAEFLARHLEAAGVETHIERLGPRNANMWAVLEGEQSDALVLHNHMDVEPVRQPDRWTVEPFAGEISPPWIIGRGAFDMKSVTIAQLMSVLDLARRGEPLSRSVIFLATGDEETGSRLGTRWLIQHHPELIDRFWAVLTEGGAVEARSLEEIKYWGTEFAQKRFLYVEACHGSQRRLEALWRDLRRLNTLTLRRSLLPEIETFLDRYGPTRDSERYRELLADPASLLVDARLLELPWYLQLSMRHEVAPFPVVEDPEGGFKMRIILHLFNDSDPTEAIAELLPDGAIFGVPYVLEIPHEVAPASPIDHPLFVAIDEMTNAEFEGGHGPLFVPLAATDARYYRAIGIPAYGYSPFRILATDTLTVTGPNERVALEGFVEGVDRYRQVVRHVLGLDTESP
ncbi:MAG: M20/M25/M40 family metallo-hydrolase [Acidobacteriota bacterium]